MKIRGLSAMMLILGVTGIMYGCGNDQAPLDVATGPSGTVQQGPVSGATVVAKKVGNKDFSKAETGELTAKTNSLGKFQFATVPSYAYTLVTLPDGTDTLGAPGNKNIQLIAKAGSQYVNALTTLVAVDTTGTVEAKLLALTPGITDIGNVNVTNTTPAALVVAKSVETCVAAMQQTVTKSAGTAAVTDTQLAAVQSQTLSAISSAIGGLAAGTATATLQAPATLNTTVMTPAITAAVTTITTANTNITVSDAATVATAIASGAVDSSAKAIIGATSGSGDATLANATTAVLESSVISTADATAISTATTTASTAASAATTVVATPPTYVPPVVRTALAAVVVSSTLTIPATGSSTITIKLSHAVNNDGDGSVTVGGVDVPGTAALNSAGDTITFTSSSSFRPAAGTVITVTVSGNTALLTTAEQVNSFSAPMQTKTWDFTVPAYTSGATGGSSAGTGLTF